MSTFMATIVSVTICNHQPSLVKHVQQQRRHHTVSISSSKALKTSVSGHLGIRSLLEALHQLHGTAQVVPDGVHGFFLFRGNLLHLRAQRGVLGLDGPQVLQHQRRVLLRAKCRSFDPFGLSVPRPHPAWRCGSFSWTHRPL